MLWDDIPMPGCKTSFGSPSGGATRSSALTFMIIFDLFFSSAWSRKKYPELNRMTPSSHKLTFAAITLPSISYWIVCVYSRLY